MNRAEQIEQAINRCDEESYWGSGVVEIPQPAWIKLQEAVNLLTDVEPACYITIDALNALKTNTSASVRVWAKADEEQVDIPLYTHLQTADAEELIMRIDAESKWAGYGGSLHQLLTDLRTYIAGA